MEGEGLISMLQGEFHVVNAYFKHKSLHKYISEKHDIYIWW